MRFSILLFNVNHCTQLYYLHYTNNSFEFPQPSSHNELAFVDNNIINNKY